MPQPTSFTRHIPNFTSLLNLSSGYLSIFFCLQGELHLASWMVFLAVVFDFLDGFLARFFHAQSELGKQLDSLADVVSFGIAPALLLLKLFQLSYILSYGAPAFEDLLIYEKIFLFSTVFIPVASAYRLAKFNIDPDQKDKFLGLPTPANGIFIASYVLIILQNEKVDLNIYLLNPFFLFFLNIFLSAMMVSRVPMFAIKFNNYYWKENRLRYVFIGISFILVMLFRLVALPVIILLYIIVSAGYFLKQNRT